MMIPELVLGMAYLSVFTAVGVKLGMGALILTHTTFCIPYVLINVKSRLIGMDPSLSEAARDLGASRAGAEGHHAAAGFPRRAVRHDALRRHEP